MKKIIPTVLILFIIFECAGCGGSTWRRKFVRKKDAETKEGPILQPQDYKKEFTNKQFYANHYAFWKNAEAETMESIKEGKNEKRIKLYSSNSLIELQKIRDLLTEEKQKELTPLVEEFKKIVEDINKPDFIRSHKNILIRSLTHHYRLVTKNFNYRKVENHIKPDEE